MREPLIHLTATEMARLRIARQAHVERSQRVPRSYQPRRYRRLAWRDIFAALPGLILMGLAFGIALGLGAWLVAPRLAWWLWGT